MPNPDPLDQITGLASNLDVSKPETRAYLRADLHCFADCAAVRNLDLSARTRIMAGNRFFRKDTTDISADDGTETTPVIIDGAGIHWVVIEGERYDLPLPTVGLLGTGETFPAWPIPTPLVLPATLPGSFVYAVDGTPTGSKTITFKKSLDKGATWTTVFTATFASGAREATLTLAADVSLPAGSLLRAYGPSPADPTLSGLTGIIVAIR